jgi:hypothetical protein
MVPIVAEGMSYDWGKDIEVVKAVSTGAAGITNDWKLDIDFTYIISFDFLLF